MMTNEFLLNFFIGFLSAILLCFVLFWYFYNQKIAEIKRAFSKLINTHEGESRATQEELLDLKIKYATSSEQINSLKNSKIEIENIANLIFEKNSHKILQNNHANLTNLLKPFKDNLQDFNQKIDNYYKDESKERFSLVKEISKLNTLNQKISQDAVNLTNALKGDNKVQGNWGEYILERVLESSGLKKGREYEIQKEFKDKEGNRFRPDVIVHLPDKKDIIIDSKLSLTAYERYHRAKKEKKDEFLEAHLTSLYAHIRELKSKNYHKLPNIQTLDFVLMFIPIEAAFLLAVQKDNSLYEKAYSHNIIIVSPSTLLAVLRTIQNSWRYEYQNSNAQLIAKKAGDMHSKFIGFINDLQAVESSLNKAQASYESAFKKLSSGKGNLVDRSKQLKELDGVYAKKIES